MVLEQTHLSGSHRAILSPLVLCQQIIPQVNFLDSDSTCSTPVHSPILKSLKTPLNNQRRSVVSSTAAGSPLKRAQLQRKSVLTSSNVASPAAGRKVSFSGSEQSESSAGNTGTPSMIRHKKRLSLVSAGSSSRRSSRTPLSLKENETPSRKSVGPLVDMDDVSNLLRQFGLEQDSNKFKSPRPSSRHSPAAKSTLKRAGKAHTLTSGLLNSPTQWQKKKTSYDRFIPNRSAMDMANAQANLTMTSKMSDTQNLTTHSMPTSFFDNSKHMDNSEKVDPESLTYQFELAKACGLALDKRILSFRKGTDENTRTLTNVNANLTRPLRPYVTAAKRKIPTAPERILDAPGIADDFYLNLLDWSCSNVLAVGLGNSVYLWNATAGSVSELCSIEDEEGIASLSWSQDGCYLAIGDFQGKTHIWDVETENRIRSLNNPHSRVGVLSWNREILSNGMQSGAIYNHDVRLPQSRTSTLTAHNSDIAGLKWSHDGAQLASGGNDNLVNIWDARASSPKFTKRDHVAAVKALGWCPWQTNLLATGGGTEDKKIHFWNTGTGAKNATIDTGAQVTGLVWSKCYRELISSHGFAENQLIIWKYPTLKKVMELPHAHDSRILHTALSPDGQTVCTGAADETLKFWKVFALDPKLVKTKTSGASKSTGDEKKNISPDLGYMNLR